MIEVMAKKYNATAANVLVSYHISQGVVALVKSTNPVRLKENLRMIELDATDIKTLNELNQRPGKTKRYNTPLWGWDLGFSDWYEQD